MVVLSMPETEKSVWHALPNFKSRQRSTDEGDIAGFIRSLNMNKDQVKGAAKEVAGKVQQQAGKLTGSEEHEAKGIGKQVEGKVQKNVGNAEEVVKDTLKKDH
jgi:uncharacterized protein YjbJ (UPF0337 family)